MTIEVHELQRVAFTEEASDAFATDVTGSATYQDIPVQGVATVSLDVPELDPNVQQQRIDSRNVIKQGPRSATLSFTCPLGATGVAAGDGDTSPAYTSQGLLWMLKTAFGGANDGNVGGTVTSASDAYTITPSLSTLFDGGEIIGRVNAGGRLEARTSTAQFGAVNSMRDQFSATPSASDVLYAGTTIHPTENPLTSMQFIVEGAEEDDRWLLMGGQITSAPSITLTLGEIPTITFSMTFADWAAEPAAAITPASHGTFEPIDAWESLRIINGTASGSISGACLDASSVSITFNSPVFQAIRSGCGTNTIKGFRRLRATPFAEVTVHVPFEDTSWFTERDDEEFYGLFIQAGHVAGNVWMLDFPNCQVLAPQRIDEGGLAYQSIKFVTTTDTFVTQADDDDIRYAAFRLHFL